MPRKPAIAAMLGKGKVKSKPKLPPMPPRTKKLPPPMPGDMGVEEGVGGPPPGLPAMKCGGKVAKKAKGGKVSKGRC